MVKDYQDMLEQVDWNLPGMENFSKDNKEYLTRFILDGTLVNDATCLGWALWPTKNEGFYDEKILRVIADFIEIQNKPFWDDYAAYCYEQEQLNIDCNPCSEILFVDDK